MQFYQLYIGLIETLSKRNEAFYFKPKSKTLSFENSPVGINTLNSILPNLCKAAGIKRKTAHCLRVTCVSKLFNSGVEEKLIGESIKMSKSSILMMFLFVSVFSSCNECKLEYSKQLYS